MVLLVMKSHQLVYFRIHEAVNVPAKFEIKLNIDLD